MSSIKASERKPLSQERLDILLHYDAATGEFIWKARTSAGSPQIAGWNTRHAGRVAGSFSDRGYRIITIDSRPWFAHQLVFLHYVGNIPETIDHIDRDRTNNRWGNLRAVTDGLNQINTKPRALGVLGVRGVARRYNSKGVRYISMITIDGNRRHLGTFDTAQEAQAAFAAASKERWGSHTQEVAE